MGRCDSIALDLKVLVRWECRGGSVRLLVTFFVVGSWGVNRSLSKMKDESERMKD